MFWNEVAGEGIARPLVIERGIGGRGLMKLFNPMKAGGSESTDI